MIPEDWELVKLGECIELKYGKSLPQKNRKKGKFPVYGSNGIIDHHNEYFVKSPGVIIGRKGSVGEISFSFENFYPIDTTYYVVLKKGGVINFWYYFLQLCHLTKMNSHAAVPGLNREDVYSLKKAIPPLSEQKAISKILSDLDEKIEVNRNINEILEELGQTLFKRWFVDFEFPNEKGKPYRSSGGQMVKSELGEIPEGWEVRDVYSFADIIFGMPFSSKLFNEVGDGIPLIRIRDLKTMTPDFCTTEEHGKGTLIEPGEVIVGMDAEFRPTIWAGKTSWLNQRLFLAKPNKNYIHRFFVCEAIRKPLTFFENSKVGTTVIHLSKRDIDSFEFALPIKNYLLKRFSEIIDPLYKKMVNNSQEIRDLSKTRDLLLPKLMTGEMRVKL